MKLRPVIFSLLVGLIIQIGLGTIINVLSYFPVHDATTTGTLFEPLVPFVMFALQLGVVGLFVDLVAGWLAGRWGGSARDGALTGGLTQLIGGFINGLGAWIVLLVVLQQVLANSGVTVRGLTESYNGMLLLIAASICVVGWLAGSVIGAIVGGIGGRVGVRVRPRE